MKNEIKAFLIPRQGRILQGVLAVASAFFIGVLIFAYFAAKSANPIFLDEKGRPIEGQTQSRGY